MNLKDFHFLLPKNEHKGNMWLLELHFSKEQLSMALGVARVFWGIGHALARGVYGETKL